MEVVNQGLILTLLGMGWVFIFLGIMVASVSLMKFVARLLPQDEVPAQVTSGNSSGPNDSEVVAAIAAAKAANKSL